MQKIIKYYSFQEIIDYLADNYPIQNVNYPSAPNLSSTSANWFTKALQELGFEYNFVGFKANSSVIPSNVIEEFVNRLIQIVYNRHNLDFIAEIKHNFLEAEDEDIDIKNASDIALNKLVNVLNLTAPRYIPILSSYVDNYENPIKMLESISESFSRFNDTPQNEIDEVDYNTPAYATNMGKNKSVSKVDSGSVVDRLNSLVEKFRSVILDWSNEFSQLFLNDLQLEY